jgi:hypothetical protein
MATNGVMQPLHFGRLRLNQWLGAGQRRERLGQAALHQQSSPMNTKAVLLRRRIEQGIELYRKCFQWPWFRRTR